jgi:hypothetical protein
MDQRLPAASRKVGKRETDGDGEALVRQHCIAATADSAAAISKVRGASGPMHRLCGRWCGGCDHDGPRRSASYRDRKRKGVNSLQDSESHECRLRRHDTEAVLESGFTLIRDIHSEMTKQPPASTLGDWSRNNGSARSEREDR